MFFENNIGKHLSLDEISLSKGELYIYLTNKEGKGKKGTLVACIKGTKSCSISNLFTKIPLEKRLEVEEGTLDMVRNMDAMAEASSLNAKIVTDRFHIVKLVFRWTSIFKEKLR